MGDSAVAFAKAVWSYWSAWVPGGILVVVWAARLMSAGLDKWTETHFARTRQRQWSFGIFFAGLLLAAFFAFHDERTARFATVVSTDRPELRLIDSSETAGTDGLITVRRLYEVIARSRPGRLTVFLKGEGAKGLDIDLSDTKRFSITGGPTEISGVYTLWIQDPIGKYTFLIKTDKSRNYVLDYNFE
jgi:hypothetical protein